MLCSLVGGWAGGRDVEETDDVRFERMIDLNLRSAFYAVRAAVPYLRQAGWGRILLVGSKAVEEAPPGQAAFNIAKAGWSPWRRRWPRNWRAPASPPTA
jgi:Short-chain alcohol dehydrogenase of unknown specificity